jgi:hypothetical protein
MLRQWRAKVYAFASQPAVRIAFLMVVIAAIALAAGAPDAWGT